MDVQLTHAVGTGASSWLTALLLEEHGFTLHKGVLEMLYAYIVGGTLQVFHLLVLTQKVLLWIIL